MDSKNKNEKAPAWDLVCMVLTHDKRLLIVLAVILAAPMLLDWIF